LHGGPSRLAHPHRRLGASVERHDQLEVIVIRLDHEEPAIERAAACTRFSGVIS
jgi:hypothetical protein